MAIKIRPGQGIMTCGQTERKSDYYRGSTDFELLVFESISETRLQTALTGFELLQGLGSYSKRFYQGDSKEACIGHTTKLSEPLYMLKTKGKQQLLYLAFYGVENSLIIRCMIYKLCTLAFKHYNGDHAALTFKYIRFSLLRYL